MKFVGGCRKDGTEWTIEPLCRDYIIDESLAPVTAVFAVIRLQDKILAVTKTLVAGIFQVGMLRMAKLSLEHSGENS